MKAVDIMKKSPPTWLKTAAAVLFVIAVAQGFSDGQDLYPHKNPGLLPMGCGSCHVGHGVPGTTLLPFLEENNCYSCHGEKTRFNKMVEEGKVAPTISQENIYSVFQKPFRHPVEISGAHKAGEVLPESNPAAPRHAECVDCHDAHDAKRVPQLPQEGSAPKQSSMKDVNLEYELCFRCHSTSANKPYYSLDISRLTSPGNPSYHPIEAPSKSATFTSDLVPPYVAASIINCTDCHGNDEASGPKGPHGSNYEGMLVSPYALSDGALESQATYRLCYTCHSRSVITEDIGFTRHHLHVNDQRTSCNTCHDPHGSERNPALINFDTLTAGTVNPVIGPSSSGRIEYYRFAPGSGECYLTCHGVDHNPKRYP